MDISVIIPTHNRADALEKTLERLARQDFAGEWETIIADNNSTENIEAVVERWKPKFPTSLSLVHETVPGAAATRNAGAKTATGDYLLFLDNDILTEPDFLTKHLNALQQNPNSWMTGAVANLPEQAQTVFGRYRQTLFPMPSADEPAQEIEGISAQNFSLPRAHFEQLGGFDVNFYSGEDFELAMRGREKFGVVTMLDPGIVTLHNDWAGWTFADFARRQRIYSQTEFYFWEKYRDRHPRPQLVKENLPANWNTDSAPLFLRKKFKRFLSGSAAQTLLSGACAAVEKTIPFPPLLWRLYKLMLAGAIHKGFEEGRTDYLAKRNSEAAG